MELYRLKKENDKLNDLVTKFQQDRPEGQPGQPEDQRPEDRQEGQPGQPEDRPEAEQAQPQEKTAEQKKLIMQMEILKIEMKNEQQQKKKELNEEEKATKTDVSALKEAATVLQEVEDNLKELEDKIDIETEIKTELTKFKEELHHLEIFKLIIKQITQEEIQNKLLEQADKPLKEQEAEIKVKVTEKVTKENIHQLLKPILEHHIHPIQQLIKEELRKKQPKDTKTIHEQQLMTELILRKIKPEVPDKWIQEKEKWIGDKVKKEIEQPKLEIQPQRMHDIKETIKNRINEQKKIVKELVEKFLKIMLQKQPLVTKITNDTSSNKVKLLAGAITKAQQHKSQLQQIEKRLQQIEQWLQKIQEIENDVKQNKSLDSLQKEAKELEQAAQQIEWDKYYMKIACLVALRSKDPSTPVS